MAARRQPGPAAGGGGGPPAGSYEDYLKKKKAREDLAKAGRMEMIEKPELAEQLQREREAATQGSAERMQDILSRKDKDVKTRGQQMLYDQGGISLMDSYGQKKLSKGDHSFQQWPGIIVGHEMMSSVHLPGNMSRAEYLKFYNWQEPDTATRAPMMVYKPKGATTTLYDPTHRINNMITYEDKAAVHRRRPVYVEQEPSFRALTNEPKAFLCSG